MFKNEIVSVSKVKVLGQFAIVNGEKRTVRRDIYVVHEMTEVAGLGSKLYAFSTKKRGGKSKARGITKAATAKYLNMREYTKVLETRQDREPVTKMRIQSFKQTIFTKTV